MNEYRFDQWSGKVTRKLPVEAFTCLAVNERNGRVINNATGRSIQIATANQLGSLSYLGQDANRNIYIVVEELLPGETIRVLKHVRKYSPDGNQVAQIPIDINYAAYPEKDLVLGSDGSIYHLRPLQNQLVVEKLSNQ